MTKDELIKRMDELFEDWANPYQSAARFFKAEQALKLWPEIRPYLIPETEEK